MSMHKKPLTPLEEEGLRSHGLPIGEPSQLSDAFRQGVAWQKQQDTIHLVSKPTVTRIETDFVSLELHVLQQMLKDLAGTADSLLDELIEATEDFDEDDCISDEECDQYRDQIRQAKEASAGTANVQEEISQLKIKLEQTVMLRYYIERDTGAPVKAGKVRDLVYSLSRAKSNDVEGIEFLVHTTNLNDAISLLEQLAEKLE